MIFFTSDEHFWHMNVIRYCNRPFTRHLDALINPTPEETAAALTQDVVEMNETIVARHNEIVGPDDTTYHLGDFSLAFRPVETTVKRLNGTHKLILGNHDFPHPAHKKGRKNPELWREKYIECGFSSISLEETLEIDGKVVTLHHLPYKTLDDTHPTEPHKYDKYRPADAGGILLHGHIHQHWLTRGRMINVGVDRHNFYPVSLDRVIELMRTLEDQ